MQKTLKLLSMLAIFTIMYFVLTINAYAQSQIKTQTFESSVVYPNGVVGSPFYLFPQIKLVVPKFDPKLGKLTSVNCNMTVESNVTGIFTSNSNTPAQNVQGTFIFNNVGVNFCGQITKSALTSVVNLPAAQNGTGSRVEQLFFFQELSNLINQPDQSFLSSTASPNFEFIPSGVLIYQGGEFAKWQTVSVKNDATIKVKFTYEYEPYVNCKVADKGRIVPFYSQGQSPWGSTKYANSSTATMLDLGCATTSSAMLLNSYGIQNDINGATLDPGALNIGLKGFSFAGQSHTGYNNDSNLIWTGVADYGRAAYAQSCIKAGGLKSDCENQALEKVSFKKIADIGKSGFDLQEIEDRICDGEPVIIKIDSENGGGRSHFVLATGIENTGGNKVLTVNDPGKQTGQDKTIKDLGLIKGYRLLRPVKDPSMLVITASADLDIFLIDPLGNKVGFSKNGGIVSTLPDAFITRENIGSDNPLLPNLETNLNTMIYLYKNVLEGGYSLQYSSLTGGTFSIEVFSYDLNGISNGNQSFTGTIAVGENRISQFNHSAKPTPADNATIVTHEFEIHKGGRFEAEGILKANNASIKKLDLSKGIEVDIGNNNFVLSKSEIKFKENHHEKYVLLSKNGLKIYINERGQFRVQLQSNNLFQIINQSKVLNFRLKVGDIQGEKDLKFRCNRNECEGR